MAVISAGETSLERTFSDYPAQFGHGFEERGYEHVPVALAVVVEQGGERTHGGLGQPGHGGQPCQSLVRDRHGHVPGGDALAGQHDLGHAGQVAFAAPVLGEHGLGREQVLPAHADGG